MLALQQKDDIVSEKETNCCYCINGKRRFNDSLGKSLKPKSTHKLLALFHAVTSKVLLRSLLHIMENAICPSLGSYIKF